MIRVTPRPGPATHVVDSTWDRWRKECEAATQTLIEYHEHGQGAPVEIDGELYGRKSIRRKHYHEKNGVAPPFRGKCVYCESRHGVLDIEHFRPKNSVTDASRAPAPDGTARAHPGYYWLAYDLDNLMVACRDCNTGWKGDQFPLEDEQCRAWASTDDLAREKPMLINPLVEEPSEHLTVDLATGVLEKKSPRGDRVIKLLGLNERDLPDKRRRLIMDVMASWTKWLDPQSTPAQKSEALECLREHRSGMHEFSLTARLLLDDLRARAASL